MAFALNLVQMRECAALVRKANVDLLEASRELGRISKEIDNDSDEILSKRDYGKNIGRAGTYLASRHTDLEKIAAAMDRLCELVEEYEGRALDYAEGTDK